MCLPSQITYSKNVTHGLEWCTAKQWCSIRRVVIVTIRSWIRRTYLHLHQLWLMDDRIHSAI